MLREVSTITVPTNLEARTVFAYETFGWTLAAHRCCPDEKGEPRSKLTFERDLSRQEPALVELERRYHALQDPERPMGYRKLRLISPLGILTMGFGVLVFWLTGAAEVLIGGFLLGGGLLGTGAVWEVRCRSWASACHQNQQEREEILHQAVFLRQKQGNRPNVHE